MWLLICLAVVVLGLVLMVVFGVHAYSRFRRMGRFGSRASGRLSTLADQASSLADRMDDVQQRSEVLAETAAARTAQAGSGEPAELLPARRRRR